jgi:hypothetical protein
MYLILIYYLLISKRKNEFHVIYKYIRFFEIFTTKNSKIYILESDFIIELKCPEKKLKRKKLVHL